MKSVELHPAHTWDCEECGRANFCRGVLMEFSEEDKAEMEAEHGIEFETGEWTLAPETVTCEHCGVEFKTKDDDDAEDE